MATKTTLKSERANHVLASHAHSTRSTLAAHSTTESTLVAVGGAHPLPAVGAPAVPVCTGQPEKLQKGARVRKAQLGHAIPAATDLRTSPATFTSVVGDSLVSPGDLANALEFAARWRAFADDADAWRTYARRQAAFAWASALTTVDMVEPALTNAAQHNPALTKALPSLYSFIGVPSASAKRGQENAKVRKRAEKAPVAATPAAPTAAVSSTPTPVPATASTAAPSATAPLAGATLHA